MGEIELDRMLKELEGRNTPTDRVIRELLRISTLDEIMASLLKHGMTDENDRGSRLHGIFNRARYLEFIKDKELPRIQLVSTASVIGGEEVEYNIGMETKTGYLFESSGMVLNYGNLRKLIGLDTDEAPAFYSIIAFKDEIAACRSVPTKVKKYATYSFPCYHIRHNDISIYALYTQKAIDKIVGYYNLDRVSKNLEAQNG